MPGSVLFDIGDAFRSLFTGDNEDNKNTSLLKVNFEVYKAFISGYLSKMKNELSKTEIELRLTDCSFKSWESSMWFSYFSCHPPSRSSFLQLKMDNLKQNNENKVEK